MQTVIALQQRICWPAAEGFLKLSYQALRAHPPDKEASDGTDIQLDRPRDGDCIRISCRNYRRHDLGPVAGWSPSPKEFPNSSLKLAAPIPVRPLSLVWSVVQLYETILTWRIRAVVKAERCRMLIRRFRPALPRGLPGRPTVPRLPLATDREPGSPRPPREWSR